MKLSNFLLLLLILISCKPSATKQTQEVKHLPFYNTGDFTPEWIAPSSPKYATIHTIPAFQFSNQNGNIITQNTFNNKIYVADFFFTTCPGICKKLTSNLTIVQKAFKNDTDVLLLSHSVTPENDSIPKLKKYATNFGIIDGKWHLVTGNRKAIYTIAREAYFADEDLGVAKNENDFLHTENILLIDKHKRIRGIYKGTLETEIQHLIDDINLLKLEQ